MTPELWKEIRSAFDEALGLPPEERPAFLVEHCGDRPAVLTEVRSLLASHDAATTFIDRPVARIDGPVPGDDDGERPPPEVLGSYRLEGALGKGGMGSVYLAVRADDEYKKRVAVKILRGDLGTAELVRRFRSERQILANLDHPNIAKLLDGGTTDDGRPFLVMEHIDGKPVGAYCDEHRLNLRQRLELFQKVCRAVQFAHQNLIVHRDLKPDNILVTADGEPHLLDFGIAKLLDTEAFEQTVVATDPGVAPMTPAYASPEQIRRQPITTASDVYALGVLLFELLTGHRPYRPESYGSGGLARAICEEEPRRPSTVVLKDTTGGVRSVRDRAGSEPGDGNQAGEPGGDRVDDQTGDQAGDPAGDEPRDEGRRQPGDPSRVQPGGQHRAGAVTAEELGAARGSDPRSLSRRLQGDLDTIVLMALRKDPQRRYASAEQLAQDLERYLAGMPVSARPDTLAYRTRKFIGRHRFGVAVTTLGLALLVAFLVVLLTQRQEILLQSQRATEVSDFLIDLFEVSDPGRSLGEKVTARELLDRGAQEMEVSLAGQPDLKADLMAVIGRVYRKLGLYEEARPRLEQAYAQHAKNRGPRDLATLKVQLSLAEVLVDQGEYAEAGVLYDQALPALRAKPAGAAAGDARQELVRGLRDLAKLHQLNGDFREADDRAREALDLAVELFGTQDERVAAALDLLGGIRHEADDLDEGQFAYEKALEIYRQLYGERHPRVADIYNNLGQLLLKKGEPARAEEFHRRALAIQRQVFEEDHPALATTFHNLGSALQDEQRFEEAEAAYSQALELRRRIYGEHHPKVGSTLNNIGQLHDTLGDLDEAERILRQALDAFRSGLEEEHPETAIALNNLAQVLKKRGDLEGAEALLRQFLVVARKAYGPRHSNVATGLNNLASVLKDQDEKVEAEALQREALEILRERLGPDHPHVGSCALNLGALLVDLGRHDEAEGFLLEAKRNFSASLEPGHAYQGAVLQTLAALALEQGRAADAETRAEEALAIYTAALPEDHRWIHRTRSLLGEAKGRLGRTAEARALLERCLEQALSSGDQRLEEDTRQRLAALSSGGAPDS